LKWATTTAGNAMGLGDGKDAAKGDKKEEGKKEG
jgi:hypothetical protein